MEGNIFKFQQLYTIAIHLSSYDSMGPSNNTILIYNHTYFQNYIYGMLFDDKKKRLTTTEETLKVTQKIATGIEKLQTSMENLATSIDTQTNKVEVGTS